MAKENEKKVSGEINEEELENVAGGWCSFFSTQKPKLQANQTATENKDGGYSIETDFGGGQMGTSVYDKKGNFLGGAMGRKG